MSIKSAALFRAANVRIMDYPLDAALSSALSVCDEAVIVVGPSQDDTARWVSELADTHRGRVTVAGMEFVYDRGWQERWWNYASAQTDADWLMFHDADELVHEQDAPAIRRAMADPDNVLIRFDFIHFYGTARYQKAIYPPWRNARIGRRSHGYRMVNWCTDETPTYPACQMVMGDGGIEAHSQYQGPGIVDAPGPIYHYGACRDARAMTISTLKHVAWYKDGDGLEDGRVPDAGPTDYKMAEKIRGGVIEPFVGTHPAAIDDWLQAHEAQWAALEAGCRE